MEIVSVLQPTTVYALAAQSTPDTVKTDLLERLENGEAVTDREVKKLISQHKEEMKEAAASKLGNISTRGFVGSTPGDSIIAGFILGNGNVPDRVIIRGLGPSLAAQGVPNTLDNPTLELHNGDGALLFTNNDWIDNPTQAAEIAAAGFAPKDTRESAIAVTLPPGLYTAILAGLGNTIGNALVEIYDRGPTP